MRVFVVVCSKCGECTAAYDPQRCRPGDIGEAVRYADKYGHTIELREGSVVIGMCQCDRDSNNT